MTADDRVVKWAHQTGVLVVGLSATFAAGFAGFFFALFFAFGCGGSDVSAPSDSALCAGPTEDVVMWVGWAAATAAPFLGMIWAMQKERWKPLWIGCAAALGILFVLLVLQSSV